MLVVIALVRLGSVELEQGIAQHAPFTLSEREQLLTRANSSSRRTPPPVDRFRLHRQL
jgi:hypothetical protein